MQSSSSTPDRPPSLTTLALLRFTATFLQASFLPASQHYWNYAYVFHVNVSNMHFLIEFSEWDKHRSRQGPIIFLYLFGTFWGCDRTLVSSCWIRFPSSPQSRSFTSPGTFTLYLRPRFKHLSNHIFIRTPFLPFSLSFIVGSSVSMQPGPNWAWKPPPSCSAPLTPACLCHSHPSPQPLRLLAGFIHVCHPWPQAI